MPQPPIPPPRAPLSTGAPTRELARRGHRRHLLRLILLGILLVVIGAGAALVLTGKVVLPVVSEQIYPVRYREYINSGAEQYGVDPYLVAAVVKAESSFDPLAVSSAGAVGLMQLMPNTADYIVSLKEWRGQHTVRLTSPGDNVDLGACYLAYLADSFEGSSIAALAAYNAGEGQVRDWIQQAGGIDAFDMSDIRFSETRAFVKKVEKYRDLYIRIYPDGIV